MAKQPIDSLNSDIDMPKENMPYHPGEDRGERENLPYRPGEDSGARRENMPYYRQAKPRDELPTLITPIDRDLPSDIRGVSENPHDAALGGDIKIIPENPSAIASGDIRVPREKHSIAATPIKLPTTTPAIHMPQVDIPNNAIPMPNENIPSDAIPLPNEHMPSNAIRMPDGSQPKGNFAETPIHLAEEKHPVTHEVSPNFKISFETAWDKGLNNISFDYKIMDDYTHHVSVDRSHKVMGWTVDGKQMPAYEMKNDQGKVVGTIGASSLDQYLKDHPPVLNDKLDPAKIKITNIYKEKDSGELIGNNIADVIVTDEQGKEHVGRINLDRDSKNPDSAVTVEKGYEPSTKSNHLPEGYKPLGHISNNELKDMVKSFEERSHASAQGMDEPVKGISSLSGEVGKLAKAIGESLSAIISGLQHTQGPEGKPNVPDQAVARGSDQSMTRNS